ncbi:macrolide ABC transporter ATP-binding protein [bacterium SCN 62-11]|nr:ABC transporter ATP-binding protein [Candidatus Eremiobacteraeota bacterium]ODT57024.1 MAG: macrolide ABC transporter ATP-binding protein [bacterium SCN 62-11]
MKPLLRLLEVSKIYRMGEVEVPALRQASLDVVEGEFLVILGQSGSGKSTLLNLLGGMDRPTSGQVLFGDQDLARANDRTLTLYRRYQIGFVFQFFNLVPTLTALENVEVVVEIARQPMKAQEAMRLVGLEQRGHHFPSQMSGGQQQRVAIARALAGNPRLLLCDEPTGNLDTETSRQILELLQDVNQRLGKTVVMITHNLESARIGHRVAELKDGAITSVRSQVPAAAAGLAL